MLLTIIKISVFKSKLSSGYKVQKELCYNIYKIKGPSIKCTLLFYDNTESHFNHLDNNRLYVLVHKGTI